MKHGAGILNAISHDPGSSVNARMSSPSGPPSGAIVRGVTLTPEYDAKMAAWVEETRERYLTLGLAAPLPPDPNPDHEAEGGEVSAPVRAGAARANRP